MESLFPFCAKPEIPHRDDRNSIIFQRLHLSAKIVRCSHQLGRPIFEMMVKKHDELGGAIDIGRRRWCCLSYRSWARRWTFSQMSLSSVIGNSRTHFPVVWQDGVKIVPQKLRRK